MAIIVYTTPRTNNTKESFPLGGIISLYIITPFKSVYIHTYI